MEHVPLTIVKKSMFYKKNRQLYLNTNNYI